MVDIPYKVIVIVDRDFGERLAKFAPGAPVWIVDTPVNRAVAARLWKERQGESHLSGITTFKAQESSSGEELLLNELDTIDLHHGIYSSDPPYAILEVLGTSLNEKIKTKLSEYGFAEFRINADGFLAIRSLPS